jgi:transcriptional regulator with XRE-family HTH domain
MTALALKADVAPATLSLVERGKRPSRRTAEKIAAALGMEPASLWENCDELRPY